MENRSVKTRTLLPCALWLVAAVLGCEMHLVTIELPGKLESRNSKVEMTEAPTTRPADDLELTETEAWMTKQILEEIGKRQKAQVTGPPSEVRNEK